MTMALVTGATGFIGSHLVDALLARGDSVRCLVRDLCKAQPLAARGAHVVTGELLDSNQLLAPLQDVNVVFHVAGAVAARSEAEFHQVNAQCVHALATACAMQPKPPTFVLVSSVAASGPVARRDIRTEAQTPKPISAYGRSKLAGEQCARALASQLPITIVRPGVVFGPRDRTALPIFAGIKTSGFHVYPRFRTPPLSLIYVRDLITLLISAAERGARLPAPSANGSASLGQGIYFAARAEYPTYRQFGWLVAQALGRNWYLPLPLTAPLPLIIGGLSQWIASVRGQTSIVNLDKMREATVPSWACSAEQARRDLGFSPSAPLLDQLRETVAWYRAAHWL